ncbi:MAG: hypothetical protein AAGI48_09955 [Verrucomicrobiota bacterium]
MKSSFLLFLVPLLTLVACKPESPAGSSGGEADATTVVEEKEAITPDGAHILFSPELDRPAGQVIRMTEVMKTTGGSFGMESPQGKFEGDMDMTTTKELRFENESAAKVKATITRNELIQKVVMNGQEMPQAPQSKPLVGVPLLISLEEDEWKGVREDGNAVDASAEVELMAVTRKVSRAEDEGLYGSEARKVGDSWKVDAAEAMMLKEASDVEGSIELTFDKIGDHEGSECAFISGTFDMSGSAPEGPGGGDGSMSLKGTFTIIRSLEHQLDVFRELDGEMKIEMKTPVGLMTMSGPTTITETAKVGE